MPSPLASPRSAAPTAAQSSSEISQSLRAAFDLMIAHDSRPDPEALHQRTLTFMKVARDLTAAPDCRFAKEILEHYLAAYFPSPSANKVLAERAVKELPPLPPKIPNGFKQEPRIHTKQEPIRYYQSVLGLLPQDVLGVRAFQRDYISHLNEVITTVERLSQVPSSLTKEIDQLSAFVLGFCGKALTPQEKPKSASSIGLAHLLFHSQPVDPPTLKLAVSNLSLRDSVEPLQSAIVPLFRRARELGVVIPPEMEKDITAWAARKEPLHFSSLPQEERDHLVRSLRVATSQFLAGARGQALELEWMAKVQDAQRDFEYRFDKADKDPKNPDHIPDYPEVNYRFTRALRLTMPELNDLKRASDFLEREGLCGLRVEMDQSLFLWPRIAETILTTQPSEIILHSPTANEPFEAPTGKSFKPFLCQRSMHVIPVTLTTSPKEILEQETYLANKATIDWASSSHGEVILGERKSVVRIAPDLQATDVVRAAAPHIKPNSNCFVIRHPKAPPTAPPIALGVFFSNRLIDIKGHKTHTFGKTIQLFIAETVKEVALSQPEETTPPIASKPSLVPQELTPPPAPVIPEQRETAAQTPEVLIPKKVKKAPPPPPVKEPRPRISDDQARIAKEVVAALPEIQAAARSSRALKPEVPFTNPEIMTTLHVLKNGEKPGTKKLKAVLEYVSSDSNFRDAITSSRLRSTREALTKILTSLVS